MGDGDEVVGIAAGFVPVIGEGVARGKHFVERVGELEDLAKGSGFGSWKATEYAPPIFVRSPASPFKLP